MTEFFPAFLNDLLYDPDVADLIGTDADLAAMLAFEVALGEAAAAHGFIPADHARALTDKAATFQPDRLSLQSATLKDGVVIPDYVRQLREHVGGEAAKSVHFGATSQDVIDTALALKLGDTFDLFEARLTGVAALLEGLIENFGSIEIPGRTRMQSAIPITSGDRIRVWLAGVTQALNALEAVREQSLILSLAGAAGTAEKYGDRIGAVREDVARSLGLTVPAYVPHAARGRIADLGNWLSRITGALGKIGQDVALMAQNEMAEVALSGGGASSAMPHKQNPVRAEVLVTLARFNATQVSALHQSLIHEQERSGAAWTLEWLVLPQMLNATGVALKHAASLISGIKRVGKTG
ncbi:3-carboxy-cis,cis-muconate cycloisomerase [Rhizobium sp. C4]|uniref:3-carboxy-cis,cis-muconate cycloisomerase n=1 Tax=Rhizobium sp. C4 TaxID=1349800 RepID=UPI001E2CDA90|nr:3-carboxy-cis,cis-muconate cycloisomerase [Rhizobium sp. C4]MCD2174789.1 3-carboxy-cis,cis-muconate cycloisomerase [Rhizobium sp. C4]